MYFFFFMAGINRYIDIFHTLQKCSFVTEDCNKKRTDCNTIASKSNQYKIEYRWLLYLISDERLQKKLFDRKVFFFFFYSFYQFFVVVNLKLYFTDNVYVQRLS